MKRVNSEGPAILDPLPGGRAMNPKEFAGSLEGGNAVVIDLRRPEAFGGAHIPGSLNIGAGQNLSMWAGWVVPYDRPLLLVGDDGTAIEEARRSLIRVGFDDIRGYLKGGMRAWIEAGLPQAHLPQQSVGELQDKLVGNPFILDVRSLGEWKSGHIEGAVHIPCGELPGRVHELPAGTPIHVICGSGYRSGIAGSILRRAGLRDVINIVGGMGAWNARGLSAGRS